MKKTLRILFGVSLVLVSLWVIRTSSTFPEAVSAGKKIPGPAFFPVLLSVVLIPCGFHQAVSALRSGTEAAGRRWGSGTVNGAIVILSLVVYVQLMQWMGYALSTFLFSMFLLLRLRVGVLKALAVTIITVVFILLVFGRLFQIQLPLGELGIPW
ncbi:MAG TPA: tripartite tricarboxylate transporter TctB family protein [Aminivibrio sp.]|nr:tripartite tricarboxylate transporter TctB family protein [Aminivibrio sp.]